MHCDPELEQFWQAPPKLPHTLPKKPAWQMPNWSQHPVGHVWALHPPPSKTAAHCWPLHSEPGGHVLHELPRVPHAALETPEEHIPNGSQQPIGQVCALQVPASGTNAHWPLEHCSPSCAQF